MSNETDPMVGGRLLSSLKVTELREELDNRGLNNKGVKLVLQERLREYLNGDINPVVAEYKAKQMIELEKARAADPRNKVQEQPKEKVAAETESPLKTDQKEEGASSSENVIEKEASVAQNDDASRDSSSSGTSSGSSSSVSSSSTDSDDSANNEVVKQTENESNIATESEPIEERSTANESTDERPIEKKPAVVSDEPAEKVNEPVAQQASDNTPQESGRSSDVKTEKEKAVKATSDADSKKKAIQDPPAESKPRRTSIEKSADDVVMSNDAEEEGKPYGDDGDELDYGDDDEKEMKDEMEEEPVAKKSVGSPSRKKETKPEKKEKHHEEKVFHRRASSPSSRHPISNILHIRGLVRPFTERMLREFITSHGGEITDFWIDKVKSHCFVKMDTPEAAGKVMKAMNGTHWPESNPKVLAIVHETEENMSRYVEGKVDPKLPEAITIGTLTNPRSVERKASTSTPQGKSSLRITVENAVRDNSKRELELKEKKTSLAGRLSRVEDKPKEEKAKVGSSSEKKRKRSETPPFSRGAGFMDDKRVKLDDDHVRKSVRKESEHEEPVSKTPDELFRKTKALPSIYYLPLTDEQVAENEKKKEKVTSSRRLDERPEKRKHRD